MTISNLFLLFFAVLALSLVLSPLVMKISLKADLTDDVNHRSAHIMPTPRGGGLIFIIATAIILIVNLVHPFFIIPENFSLILCLSFACAMIGFLDDKYSLPSWLRLCGQVALVTYPSLHFPLFFLNVPATLQYLLYIISWVWFINLFNFMDGTDGYAAQEAIFILLFIAIVSPALSAISVCLVAAVFGFLKVNYPKATIFMGDAGSYFLGYLLFGLMIYSFSSKPHLLVPCMIVSLLFTADATHTLIKRMIKREFFFSAHRSHWYQRLYNLGYSHGFIFWVGILINGLLLLLALIAWHYHAVASGLILAIGLLIGVGRLIKTQESTSLIREGYEK